MSTVYNLAFYLLSPAALDLKEDQSFHGRRFVAKTREVLDQITEDFGTPIPEDKGAYQFPDNLMEKQLKPRAEQLFSELRQIRNEAQIPIVWV